MAETDQDEAEAGAPAGKPGLLGNKKMLMIAIVVVVLLLAGIGAALYLFVFSKSAEPADAHAAEETTQAGPPAVAYFDMPDILANIQGADGSTAYLKLSVSLEVGSPEEKAGIEALQPRITDQLQAYVRELRADDLKGSAGVMRLKEEMLRRVNAAAVPYHVRDVLLKEMVVQ